MAVFKCKMCGGEMTLNGNTTVGVCPYCGTTQTFPRLDMVPLLRQGGITKVSVMFFLGTI